MGTMKRQMRTGLPIQNKVLGCSKYEREYDKYSSIRSPYQSLATSPESLPLRCPTRTSTLLYHVPSHLTRLPSSAKPPSASLFNPFMQLDV